MYVAAFLGGGQAIAAGVDPGVVGSRVGVGEGAELDDQADPGPDPDVGAEPVCHLVGEVDDGLQARVLDGGNAFGDLELFVHQGAGEGFLGREVEVEGALGDPGVFDDVTEAGAFEPTLIEGGGRAVEDGLTGDLGPFLPGSGHVSVPRSSPRATLAAGWVCRQCSRVTRKKTSRQVLFCERVGSLRGGV